MANQELRKVEELSFLEASRELEQIVRSLEKGDLELEESLTRYARGVELLSSLRERLANAEQKVKELVETADGTVIAVDAQPAPATMPVNE